MKAKYSKIALPLLIALSIFSTNNLNAQIRTGLGYLKIVPGARQLGVAGTLTASLDYNYAFYTNPGATGFMREWQWSVFPVRPGAARHSWLLRSLRPCGLA